MVAFLMVEISWFRNGIKEGFSLLVGDFPYKTGAAVWITSLEQGFQQLNERLGLTDSEERIRFKVDPLKDLLEAHVLLAPKKIGTVELVKEAEKRFAVTAGVLM